MEGRKQFTFYRSYFQALSKLPRERRLSALEAVIGYALDGVEPEGLDDMQAMAFLLIRPTLDSGRKKAAGGKLGGSKTQAKRKDTASKGEKEKEIEDEIEIEKELENELEDECLWREGFDSFWDLYPVKVGKANAIKLWQEMLPEAGAVCDGVRLWLRSEQWKRENGRFIPRAAKFLQEKHYLDAPREVIPKGASGVLGEAELEAIRMILAEGEDSDG